MSIPVVLFVGLFTAIIGHDNGLVYQEDLGFFEGYKVIPDKKDPDKKDPDKKKNENTISSSVTPNINDSVNNKKVNVSKELGISVWNYTKPTKVNYKSYVVFDKSKEHAFPNILYKDMCFSLVTESNDDCNYKELFYHSLKYQNMLYLLGASKVMLTDKHVDEKRCLISIKQKSCISD